MLVLFGITQNQNILEIHSFEKISGKQPNSFPFESLEKFQRWPFFNPNQQKWWFFDLSKDNMDHNLSMVLIICWKNVSLASKFIARISLLSLIAPPPWIFFSGSSLKNRVFGDLVVPGLNFSGGGVGHFGQRKSLKISIYGRMVEQATSLSLTSLFFEILNTTKN